MPDVSTSHLGRALTAADLTKAKTVASAIMFKASQGVSFEDPNFEENLKAADSARLPWGAYHWITGDASGWSQATYFTGITGPRPAFYCVDWEATDPKFGTDAPRATVQDFLDHMNRITDKPVIMYSGVYAREHGGYFPAVPTLVPDYGPASLPASIAAPITVGWQYTNGQTNGTNMPSSIPGIGACDVSTIFKPELLGLGQGDDMTLTPQQQTQLGNLIDELLKSGNFNDAVHAADRIAAAVKNVESGSSGGLTVSQGDARYALKPGVDGGHEHTGKVTVA